MLTHVFGHHVPTFYKPCNAAKSMLSPARCNAIWRGAKTLDEDATLAKGLLVNCLAVGQALAVGILDTRTMGRKLDLFDDGELIFEG